MLLREERSRSYAYIDRWRLSCPSYNTNFVLNMISYRDGLASIVREQDEHVLFLLPSFRSATNQEGRDRPVAPASVRLWVEVAA